MRSLRNKKKKLEITLSINSVETYHWMVYENLLALIKQDSTTSSTLLEFKHV